MTLWGERVDTGIPYPEEQCSGALNERNKHKVTAMSPFIMSAIQDCGQFHQSFRAFSEKSIWANTYRLTSRRVGPTQCKGGPHPMQGHHLPSFLAHTWMSVGVPPFTSFLLCSQCPCVPINQLGMCVGHQEGQQENREGAHPKGFCPTFHT